MTKTDRTEPESGDNPTAKRGDTRRTRGIRFSESEWEDVKAAAQLHDVPAAEFCPQEDSGHRPRPRRYRRRHRSQPRSCR